MANLDKPNGAIPVGNLSGSPVTGQVRKFPVDGSGADIFPGDFVEMNADGNVDVATAGAVELLGVMVGFLGHQESLTNGVSDGHSMSSGEPVRTREYYDASADGAGYILVIVGDEQLYELQEIGGGTPLTIADVGLNIDLLATAGSTVTGRSRQELNSGAEGTATAQLRIVGPVDRINNEVGSDNARWIVKINEGHYNKLAGL